MCMGVCPMGLFGGRKDKSDDYRELTRLVGIRSEVMTREGRLIFFASAELAPEGGVMVRPITTSRLDPSIPRYPVMLRGYLKEEKRAVHILCYISARPDGGWNVTEPESDKHDNDRNHYRLETAIPAEVMAAQHRDLGMILCQITNISAGGVRIMTTAELKVDEKLSIRSMMLESMGIAPLMCVIRRAIRHRGGIEYGCEFLGLTPQIEEQLAQLIMDMERQRRVKEEE